jgi:methyl-accepting chemotaxis protein
LRFKITALMVVLVLITAAGIGIAEAYRVSSTMENQVAQQLKTETTSDYKVVWSYFESYGNLAGYLANTNQVITAVSTNDVLIQSDVRQLFDAVMKQYPDIISVYVASASNMLITQPIESVPTDYDATSSPWYQAAMANPTAFVISEPYNNPIDQQNVITVAKAVYSMGNYVGVVAIDLSPDKIASQMLGYVNNTSKYLINRDGKVVISGAGAFLSSGTDLSKESFWKTMKTAAVKGSMVRYTLNGASRIGYIQLMPNGWYFLEAVPNSVISAPVSGVIQSTLLIGIVVLVLAILIGLVAVQSVLLKPIDALRKAISTIASGDLTVRAQVKSRDELGEMGEGINRMVESLNGLITAAAQTAEEVTNAASALAAGAEETSASVEELTAQSNEIATNAETAYHAIEDFTGGVEQVSNTAQGIATDAQMLATEADNVKSNAEEGAQSLQEVAQVVEVANKNTDETNEVLAQLTSDANNISSIVETIEQIAEQTNLLALNAAIEAARAGEAGRGFAVVADEIRKLAEKSQEATRNIAEILGGIQDRTAQASGSMKETLNVVRDVYQRTMEVEKKFSAILNSVEKIASTAEGFAAGAEELSASTEELNAAADSAVQPVETIADQVRQFSEALRQQSQAVYQIAEETSSLEKLSQELKDQVSKFKI